MSKEQILFWSACWLFGSHFWSLSTYLGSALSWLKASLPAASAADLIISILADTFLL